MTRDERFAQCIAALAIATRGELDDPTIELYDRALTDVPIHLLEAAAIELARSSKFFPRPVEWRAAVDQILDRRDRAQLGPGTQAQLPGEVGEFRCDACDNTGFVYTKIACERRTCQKPIPHEHDATVRCTDSTCVRQRQIKADAKKRYARKGED